MKQRRLERVRKNGLGERNVIERRPQTKPDAPINGQSNKKQLAPLEVVGIWVGILSAFFAVGATIYGFGIWEEERQARKDERDQWALERKASEDERQQWALEREAREEERIARAWTLLTTPASGNSGKIEALEYLNSRGVSLQDIDLSCEAMKGSWDDEQKTCERPVYLQGVDLYNVLLEGSNLSGAFLWHADLKGAFLWHADLKGADLWHADLQGASLLHADLKGASLLHADLQGASLSEAKFQDAKFLETADFRGAWAQKGYEPTGLAGIVIDICESDDLLWVKRETGCVPTMMK